MITPASFAAVLAGDMDRRGDIQRDYTAKVLKELKKLFPITNTQIGYLFDRDIPAPLDTIKYELEDVTFNALIIKHLREIRLITLVRNPQDTQVWNLFANNMKNPYNPGYSGVIFPVVNGGDFIIHNLGSPTDRSFDHAKIVIQSRDTKLNDLVIEPLTHFIEERKRSDT